MYDNQDDIIDCLEYDCRLYPCLHPLKLYAAIRTGAAKSDYLRINKDNKRQPSNKELYHAKD